MITMWKLKYTLKKIKARLKEGEVVSKTSLCLLIKKYKATGSVADYRPTARPKKLKEIHYQFIDKQMAKDDELTGIKLLRMLKEEFPDVSVSLSTVKKAKCELGWVVKRSSKPEPGPNEQPVNGEPSQQSSRQACPSEQPANQEPSQQFSEQQPLQASKDWYLKPYSLDLTTSPEETVDDLNYSSSDGSDVIVRSESNVIMIDVDLSTKESVINVGTQTDVVPYCKCEDVITAITRLTHVVQTLSSQVDTYFERLTGQLNLALDAIISHRS